MHRALTMPQVPIYGLHNPHHYSMRQELVPLVTSVGWLQSLVLNHYAITPLAHIKKKKKKKKPMFQ